LQFGDNFTVFVKHYYLILKPMRKYFFPLLIATISSSSFAQRHSQQRPFWTAEIMLSSSTFLSDLGGKNFYGSNDMTDIDFRDIRYAVGTGFCYNYPKGFSFGFNTFYTRLSADDAETTWDRSYRNLHVRTDLVEVALKLEYTVPQNSGPLRGFYINVGSGISFFNPKAEVNGTWYDLRSLGTEGQLADPFQLPYPKFSPVIPFGIGKKFYLQNGMTLGFGLSMRKSFTDYLDDVSGLYFDNNLIQAESGDIAAYLADPSGGAGGVGTPGGMRGRSTNNDNYFLTGFKLEIPLGQSRGGNFNTSCSFGGSWINKNGSLPKIGKRGKRRKIRLFK
jgi:hypothetical protein